MAKEIRKGWTDAELYEFAQTQLHELGDEGLIVRPAGISEQRFERILSSVLRDQNPMSAPEPLMTPLRKWLLDKRDTDEYGSVLDYHLDFEVVLQLIDEYSRLSEETAQGSEARRGVGTVVGSNAADKSGVEMGKVNRVEEKVGGLCPHVNFLDGYCETCGYKCPNPHCVRGLIGKGGCAICGGKQRTLISERRAPEFLTESAGSAETGGEKAAPDYENDPAHKQCVGFSDWNALLYEISKFYAKIDPEWADADIDQMDEFDPWEALRKLQANFPRSSQNQTVSGGVEGAHEGTTADKSDSRAPEKLNNAQNEARYSTENMLLPCAKCGERRAHVNHYAEYGGDHRFEPAAESKALAESSLSSPPPTKDDLSIPTSPAPLPTQLEMTKEKL